MPLTDAHHATAVASAAARFEAARRTSRLTLPPLRPAPPAGMSITGKVVRAATAWASPGRQPRALLSLVISTGSVRFQAQLDCGAGFASHLLAHNLAHALPLGEWATVECVAVTAQHDSSDSTLVCTGVRSIKRAHARV